MNIRDAYTHWSTTYDTMVNPVRDLDAVVTRQVLRDRRYRSIIEWGCGTGKNTPFLAEIGGQVNAIDFSEGMLAIAQEKVTANNVVFHTGDITTRWLFDDASTDLIVCNLILEHIADLSFVFAEAQRCLAQGGHFFLCELHPFKQYQGGQARFDGENGQVLVPAFLHHISDFTNAAAKNGLQMERLEEWWHHPDYTLPPLLISFMFSKLPHSKEML